jgi:hypothetical protein
VVGKYLQRATCALSLLLQLIEMLGDEITTE